MSPALSTAYLLWIRGRLVLIGLSVAITVLAVVARSPLSSSLHTFLVEGSFLTALGVLPLIVLFAYGEVGGSRQGASMGSSTFPANLLVFPVRTRELVMWPVLFGAVVQMVVWIAFAAGVLRPLGADCDLIWPGLGILAFTTTLQAATWSKLPSATFNLIASLGGMALITVLSVAAGTQKVSAGCADLLFLTLIVANVGTALYGLGRARNGVESHRAPKVLEEKRVYRELAPFRSGTAAQLWIEVRRNGLFLPLFVLSTCVLFGFLFFLGAQGTPVATGLPLETTDKRLFFLLCLPMSFLYASALGCSPCKVDTYDSSGQLGLFYATHPLSCVQLARAKYGSSFVASLAATVILVVALGGWLSSQLSAKADLGPRIWPTVGFGAALLLVGIWKSAIGGFCLEATGRKWLGGFFFVGLVAMMVGGPIFATRAQSDPKLLSDAIAFLPRALIGIVGLKVVVAGLGLWILRRVEVGGLKFGALVFGVWGAALALLGWAVWALFPSLPDPWRSIGGLAFFLPLNRFIWTPSALAWNRHR